MAKFGKKYRQQQIKEWEKEYINYKSLKQFIKDKRKLGSLFDIRDEIINNFKEQLDKELKKFCVFFINQERELYLGINKRLHYRNNYSSYNLEEIINEYNELFKIQNLCFNLSFYVHMNIKAIYKILKKFVHKLLSLQSDLSREYIIEKLGMKNSDLLYIFNS
jgi:SPX domain protein involved in polyphosphate accumulation